MFLGSSRALASGLLALAMLPVGWAPYPRPSAPAPGERQAQALVDHSYQLTLVNDWPGCVRAAQQATALNPASAVAYNNLAFCEARLGQWDAAIGHATVATQLDPALQLARNNLAWMRDEQARASPSRGKGE